MDEEWGVKLSPKEKSNNSMKSNEESLTKDYCQQCDNAHNQPPIVSLEKRS
jgi:hypothetical protein